MSEPISSEVPDVVPTLGFQALDFIGEVLGETLPIWQKRIVLDTFGAGPEPVSPAAGAPGTP